MTQYLPRDQPAITLKISAKRMPRGGKIKMPSWERSRMGCRRLLDGRPCDDVVSTFNAEGIAGLGNRWGGGCKSKRDQAQTVRLAGLVRIGPDVAVHGVVRWRRIDLARVMHNEFDVTLNERSVGKLLRKLGFSRISVRPRHAQYDDPRPQNRPPVRN